MQQIINKNIATVEKTILVVIDPRVESPEALAVGVINNAAVLLLDPKQDSVPQITTALTQGNYQALHLVSHGSPGCLHLGKTNLTSENISQYKQQLLEWGIGEILIYGCNVAVAPELLIKLHSLTGATIAASKQQVGNGNWHLEWQIGKIKTDSAFNPELKQKYQGVFVNLTHTTIDTEGIGPFGVAVGNLNGDGTDDILASNEFSLTNNISVLLLNDSGGLGRTFISAVPRPDGVGIGDFDGDGAADDIVFAENFATDLSIILGNGSGVFSAPTTFAGAGGFRLAIEDFNGDGTDDIAAVNSGFLKILLSNGSGGFSFSDFEGNGSSIGVAVGDFNGDDNFDVAASNNLSQTVDIFLGDGSGSFSEPPIEIPVGSDATNVAVGDLDGDGEVDDLAVVRRLEDDVAVLLGDGSGGFGAQTNFDVGANPNAVDIGDIDGDLNPDLVVANNIGNSVSVLLGDGSGSFAAQETFAVGSQPRNIAIGDFDGDGNSDDIVTANRGSGNVSLLIECFLTGTNILTEQGEVAVENLKIGDIVLTAEGQPEIIKWIGKQTIKPNQIKNPLRGYPILIKAGALGNNLPRRDLYVSPDHSMFVDGLLINAGALVNDISIIQTEPTESFIYYHVELENHCLLVAEGTAAESYLPLKENRAEYDNFAEYEELYPDGNNLMLWPMDYPRISSWNKVPRFVSKRLLAIAHQLFGQEMKLRA